MLNSIVMTPSKESSDELRRMNGHVLQGFFRVIWCPFFAGWAGDFLWIIGDGADGVYEVVADFSAANGEVLAGDSSMGGVDGLV